MVSSLLALRQQPLDIEGLQGGNMRKLALVLVTLAVATTLTGCSAADIQQFQAVIEGALQQGLDGIIRPLIEWLLGGISISDILPWA
jgi:hypothetical protein